MVFCFLFKPKPLPACTSSMKTDEHIETMATPQKCGGGGLLFTTKTSKFLFEFHLTNMWKLSEGTNTLLPSAVFAHFIEAISTFLFPPHLLRSCLTGRLVCHTSDDFPVAWTAVWAGTFPRDKQSDVKRLSHETVHSAYQRDSSSW